MGSSLQKKRTAAGLPAAKGHKRPRANPPDSDKTLRPASPSSVLCRHSFFKQFSYPLTTEVSS
jgi:hypothetical protein